MSRKIRGDGVLFACLSYSCPALREMFRHAPERDVETILSSPQND